MVSGFVARSSLAIRRTRISVTNFFAPSLVMYSRVWISPMIWRCAPLVRVAAYSAVRPNETHLCHVVCDLCAGFAVLPGALGRQREDRQGRVVTGCAGFGIGAEVANQSHVVKHFCDLNHPLAALATGCF